MRLLILALFFYLGYLALKKFLRGLPGGGRPPAKSPRGEAMVQDPHCGVYLPRGEALTKTVGGKRRFFCSEACRDAFSGKR